MPLKVGKPRDRQLVVTTHEMAVNELRDHGYPYAKVDTSRGRRAGRQESRHHVYAREPGPARALRADRDRRATQTRQRGRDPRGS